jgi:hypothetical protein
MTINPYASLYADSRTCKFLGSIPSDQLQYAEVLSWNTSIQTPLPKHTWRCTSLPYGILKAETASMLAIRIG